MRHGERETVLLICDNEAQASDLVEKLFNHDIEVVGPASRAADALSLAALSPATVALVASAPPGRRNALELADVLHRTWGVGSIILDSALPVGAEPGEVRSSDAREEQSRALATALSPA